MEASIFLVISAIFAVVHLALIKLGVHPLAGLLASGALILGVAALAETL